MRISNIVSGVALLSGSAYSLPAGGVEKRQNIDVTVLQFALTLEHLENVFYKQALQKFSLRDFEEAGYSADYYNNLKYIAYDEQQHVQLLTGAIQAAGATPVQACTYNFPYTDVRSFITLSSILEGVGTSAYLGGAPLITSKGYLTVAGSILVTEALHTSMQRLAIGEVPMANAYGTPLDPNSVYTLAAMFITSCPASNPPLPFKAFPTLQVDGKTCTCEEPECKSPRDLVRREAEAEAHWAGRHHSSSSWSKGHGWPKYWHNGANYCSPPKAGDKQTFTAANNIPSGSYLTFVSGLNIVSVKGNTNGMDITAAIPAAATGGQTYVFVTKRDVEGTFDDSAVLFGPAVLEVYPPAPMIDNSIQK